jgi:hypothetical protein
MMMMQKVGEVKEQFRRVVAGEWRLRRELHPRGLEVADSNHWQPEDNMRLGCCHTQSRSSRRGGAIGVGWVRPRELICLLLEASQAAKTRL